MPDFLTGDLWAGVASVRVGERRVLEIVNKYGKEVFLHAVEEYMDYGEQVSLAALRRLPKGHYSLLARSRTAAPVYKVTIEITDDEFIVDLRDSPDQDKGPFNMSRDDGGHGVPDRVQGRDLARAQIANGGTFRPLKVLTQRRHGLRSGLPGGDGHLLRADHPAARPHLCAAWPSRCPTCCRRAASPRSAARCSAASTRTPGGAYAVIEPELGGWGGSPLSDGNSGQFCGLHGETYNCPAEVAEARYGVTVDYLSFHDLTRAARASTGAARACASTTA